MKEILEIASMPAGKLVAREKTGSNSLKKLEIAANDEKFSASAELLRPTLRLIPFSFFKSMHDKTARMNLLTMRLRIYKDKVPDAEIPAYLLKKAANLREPFNDSPMQWSPAKRTLFYENTKYGGALEVRL